MSRHLLPSLAALALSLASVPALAGFSIDGDVSEMTVVADSASRHDLVAAIAKHLDIEVVGSDMADGSVSGRFTGSLRQVLRSVLESEGYAIAYESGRPVRVTVTGRGNGLSTYVPVDEAPEAVPAPSTGGGAAAAPARREQPAVARMLERSALTQLNQGNKAPPPPPSLPAAGNGSEDRMQQEIAEATQRALIELKALTEDLQRSPY